MADDLLARLDEAAITLLDRALASDSLAEATDGFKLAVSWLERRAKLQPAAAPKATKFDGLKRQLNNDDRAPKRGRNSAAPAEDDDSRATDA